MRLGDSTSRTGLIGRPFYFGGIQIARNFDLAPGFVSQPMPLFAGSSSLPSTVELYINDALRQTLNVPAGPFTIENPTPISGDGRARMVVRDALGRETLITQSFFSHGELLEAGLSDWSLELGAVRNGLGLRNADYGERFVAGLWRQGLSKRLTMEVRGEWGQQTRGLGVGFTQALPWQALGQASLALSEQEALGRGLQWLIGTEFGNAQQAFSLHAQGATARYRSVGLNDALPPPQWQLSGSFSHTHERYGTFGLGLAALQSRQQGRLDTYSLSHTVRMGAQGSLSTVLTRVQGASSGTLFSISLMWPLDRQINISTHLMHRSGQTDAYATASQGLRGDTGLGWRALGGSLNAPVVMTVGVNNQCVFNTYPGNLVFNYTAFSATAQTSTTSFMLRCSSGLPWTISVVPSPAVLQGLRYTITPSPASGSGNGNSGQAVTLTGSMQAGQAGTCTGPTCSGSQAHTVFITY